MSVRDLIAAFNALSDTEQIATLAEHFGLKEVDPAEHTHPQILGIYKGSVDGRTVKLTQRWHDPSQAFSIQPDINKMRLEIDGMEPLLTEFPDKF